MTVAGEEASVGTKVLPDDEIVLTVGGTRSNPIGAKIVVKCDNGAEKSREITSGVSLTDTIKCDCP